MKNDDAKCRWPKCTARWSEPDQHWYWPGGGRARQTYQGKLGDHAHAITLEIPVELYRDAFGHEVRFRGVERGGYDNVQCVLFVNIPIPDKPGEYYGWKGGEVTTWPQARDGYMKAHEEGCQAFYFALPDQLVGGVPVDTRLR